MNYMKRVAGMLGVDIDEEFSISFTNCKYKLTENGLFYYHDVLNKWVPSRFLEDLLIGQNEIKKLPILDYVEKRYLTNVIKPFRKRVKFIGKYKWNEKKESIYISLDDDIAELPSFKKGTMYKGMEEGKKYSLDELGL